ncbi:hypothetical protein SEA_PHRAPPUCCINO_27 [Mycobacterium phage Phrappuccino]|uniref:Uncharacterized protein n=1 Tax=Mycobacterium phage Phrappuccino TaxID=2591223 RepID=A0A514DDL8_9CAUD|nr:hypothetical protein KHQ87_gp027 [Mycobacterium phage Phrappuccino]QDH91705.1 hypothetical protein SEA_PHRAPPUCCINO_27 [Mycobacterium phage Phrappuccino]QIQ63149.1 hypothetical protein SEA_SETTECANDELA_27 [Mycobacterium phage Settecandela]
MSALPTLPQRQMRHAELGDLVSVLQAQQRQTVDLVVPAAELAVHGGNLAVMTAPPVIDANGVLDPNGYYRPTANADSQLASLFGIPVKYIRRLRAEHVDLYDTNINQWSMHEDFADKKVLVRLLWGANPEDPGTNGILRAVLSDRYGARDNFDTLLAVLDGIREAGLSADDLKISGDLTDDKMYVTVEAPEIQGYGWKLLEGYRSPYGNGRGTGHGGMDAENLPIVSAGLIIRNSETGGGALSITPRLVVRACSNGLQCTKDAMRQVHLGAKLAEGAIVWSDATRKAANDLARTQAADAVKSFLSATYVQKVIDEIEAEVETPVHDVPATIEIVAKDQGYTQDESKSILDHFIRGGQITAGGVLHAVTAAVQQIEDPERAFELEAGAIDAMRVAARAQA